MNSRNGLDQSLKNSFAQIKYKGDFSLFLHELRSSTLQIVPKPKKLLSAGCSGLWYFEWIDQFLGKPDIHIGVEYYSPEPDNLPDHVRWVQQNVFDMNEIESNSMDMVFSGQNIEHLWSFELSGFLLEVNRILEDEGYLIIDSPNFHICQEYNWSHPEHITELSVSQMITLLGLAGFRIEQCIGLWGCKMNDTLFPIEPIKFKLKDFIKSIIKRKKYSYKSMKERLFYGIDHPEESFLWWIVARKNSTTQVKSENIQSLINYEFMNNWRSRIQRLIVPNQLTQLQQGDLIEIPQDYSGIVIYGPYIPLRKGKYKFGYYIKISESCFNEESNESIGYIDCAVGIEGNVLATKDLYGKDFYKTPLALVFLEIELEKLTFGVQVRVIANGKCKFEVFKNLILLDENYTEIFC